MSTIYAMQEGATPSPPIAHGRPATHSTMNAMAISGSEDTDWTGSLDIALLEESQVLLKRFYQLAPRYRPLVLEHIQMLKRLQEQETTIDESQPPSGG